MLQLKLKFQLIANISNFCLVYVFINYLHFTLFYFSFLTNVFNSFNTNNHIQPLF